MQGSPHRLRTTTLQSSALYLKSVSVSERHDKPRRCCSGTHLKAIIFPSLHWLVRHTPVWLALLPVRLIISLARLGYGWPGNRLRKACLYVAPRGNGQTPATIYADFLTNALGIIENFFCLYREGGSAVLPRIVMDEKDIIAINQLIDQHGGIILAVPHNIGSAFCALRIGHTFDMLLVAKNSPTIERTRIALDFYERMPLSVLMVRGGNPFELSRVLFTVLRQGKLVAATLDNIDRSDNCVSVRMFGQDIGLSGWAAKMAVKMQVPVVPAWFHSRGRQLQVMTGEAILDHDVRTVVQHYANFFEQRILDDPASWAYLADKHWQSILAKTAGRGKTP